MANLKNFISRNIVADANFYNNVTALVIFYLKRSIAVLVLAFVAVYAADFAWVEYRTATSTEAFDSVLIQRYFAVKEKDGKTEFMFDTPRSEPCVNALFPHWGHPPCWYLKRHRRKRVDM